MKQSRFSEQQIALILKQTDEGTSVELRGGQDRRRRRGPARPRQWGACWLALVLWDRLDLDHFWGLRLTPSRHGTRWLDIPKIQVCYRLIDPGSEWRLHRHWYEHSALRDLLGCDRAIADDTLYRCLDKLMPHKQGFFSFLRARWAGLFDAGFDVLLYDLTSTYFESDLPPISGPALKLEFGAG